MRHPLLAEAGIVTVQRWIQVDSSVRQRTCPGEFKLRARQPCVCLPKGYGLRTATEALQREKTRHGEGNRCAKHGHVELELERYALSLSCPSKIRSRNTRLCYNFFLPMLGYCANAEHICPELRLYGVRGGDVGVRGGYLIDVQWGRSPISKASMARS